ncbi:hypothetical protein [Neobacillus sp. D3-1R]|uniref:hypothetical protein n=1 Tax=Neobacillus sp. D3-1R TaxID=3445778 RepID=UPI003FA03A8D
MDTNLLSVNVDKAKRRIDKLQKQIDELQWFITCAENYKPISFKGKVIKHYAYQGSILKTFEIIKTDPDFEIGKENIYKAIDITEIIDSKPMDDLHLMVRKIYRINKKNAKGN